MSSKTENDSSNAIMGKDSLSNQSSSSSRKFSGTFSRSRKNSRIATVKPVTKCLSSSEEDLAKAGRISPKGDLGSTSPRIARLLNKDMSTMEKDVIVAELEKCLAELENENCAYTPLDQDYTKIAEERDELANELENAFEELEGYMHHVRDVETDLKSIETEREELAKEVEYLKYCLTHRQEIEKTSLKMGKETLEAELKEVRQENEKMKDQINELLDERQSLIESLLNLHSSAVDDVIQTRSRSCSVVSQESTTSSVIRSENIELRDRIQEAEEAEIKTGEELAKCKEYLEDTLKEKIDLEKRVKILEDEVLKLAEENDNLLNENEKMSKEMQDEVDGKDEEIIRLRDENKTLLKDLEQSKKTREIAAQDKGSVEKDLSEKVKRLEEKNSKQSKDLCAARDEVVKQKEKEMGNSKKFVELRTKHRREKQALEDENQSLKEKIKERESEQSVVSKLHDDKETLEKQIAEMEEVLMNEREASEKEVDDLKGKIKKLRNELRVEKELVDCMEKERSEMGEIATELEKSKREKTRLERELEESKLLMDEQVKEFDAEKSKQQKILSDVRTKVTVLEESKQDFHQARKDLDKLSCSHATLLSEKGKLEQDFEAFKNESVGEKDDLIKQNDGLQQDVKDLELKIEAFRNVEGELVRTKKHLFGERNEKERLAKEKLSVENELEELRQHFVEEKDKSEHEMKLLSDKVEEWSKRLEDHVPTQLKLRDADYRLRELEQSLSDAQKENCDLEAAIEARVYEENQRHADEKQILQAEVKRLRAKLESQSGDESAVSGLKSKVGDLNIFIERAETKVKELEADLKQSKKQSKDLESSVTTLRKDKSTMQLEIGSLRSEAAILKTDLEKVTRQLRNACADVEKAVSEKKLLQEQLEYSKFELDEMDAIQKLSKETENTLMSQKENEQLLRNEELRNELLLEIDRLKDEQQMIQKDLSVTKTHLEQAQGKESKFRHSIDGLSQNIERLRRDKNLLEKSLENAKLENNELSGKIRKLSQLAPTHNIEPNMNELITENEELRHRANTLQDDVAKAHANNKTLLDRVRNSEELNANTLRSLKARKNELQMLVARTQHEKEDLEKEVKVLKEELSRPRMESEAAQRGVNESDSVRELREQLEAAREDLGNTKSQIACLEDENIEYKQKLHESEELILDLQKAVARANDVAMEKHLESSRHKRIFEKKFEKILKENFGLRKQLYFDGPSLVEVERPSHGRTMSDLASPTHERSMPDFENSDVSQMKMYDSINDVPRKKSIGEIHKVVAHDVAKEKSSSLSRSDSAPLSKRPADLKDQGQLIKAKVSIGSIIAPVKYFSDTDSIGSRPDSSDGDNAPPSPSTQKAPPPSYYETNRANAAKEQERKAISQPNKIHRPILLKEIKFPRLSPALGRRSPVKRSPEGRSPDRRSPAPDTQGGSAKNSEGKERMEHWV